MNFLPGSFWILTLNSRSVDWSCTTRTIIFQNENLNYVTVCFTSSAYLLFSIRLFSIADLFTVRYMCDVCNEDKCYIVTHRAADVRVAWLFWLLACLRSDVLRAYCIFESKQAISITLSGRRPNKKTPL